MKKVLYIFLILMLSSCNDNIVNKNNVKGEVESSMIVNNPIDEENIEVNNLDRDVVSDIVEEIPQPSIYDLDFEPSEYEIVEAFPKLNFNQPLFLSSGIDAGNIYVVEKKGVILVFANNPTTEKADVFLDITDRVSSINNEDGLLGMTFHPELKKHPYIYLYYINNGNSVVSRFELNVDNSVQVNIESELIIMQFKQPYSNHNGGHLAFGDDGYLYIASGDGGASGDPQNNGQNLQVLFGKILRIDINNISEDVKYHIPSDNPFASNNENYREEIYAYGLRNPWRFSFDNQRNILIAADVGQDKVEEIDIIINGGNYGWAKYEGTKEYKDIELQGDSDEIMPVWEYEHPVGKSITGGYTYYGSAISSLIGAYIYGDFISGRIWALWLDESNTPTNVELVNSNLNIASFGLDNEGEIYILLIIEGKYIKL